MSDVVIKIRKNGPYIVSGGAKLVDHAGNEYSLEGQSIFALCRCGQSATRPFCDGAHQNCGFIAEETAASAG